MIVWAKDRQAAARFASELLGLEPPVEFGHFTLVEAGNGVSLDFADGQPVRAHLAFLVTEREFDSIIGRVRERDLPYWADPRRTQPGRINHRDGGRGVYFGDPYTAVGWEVITRPYGSGPRSEGSESG
jgi:hypothetical protein